MCGIVAYVGDKDATEILIEGLRRLEYRGYDSAGVALLSDGEIKLRRAVGKLSNLEKALAQSPITGNVGVGHTRWATHGKPSEVNAHPHLDCTGDTVVIHNGIVENYVELKQRLIESGHRFASETDTEVIAHLVEEEMNGGKDLASAARAAIGKLRGNHAIVLMSRREPTRLIAARIGNAGGVVLGIGQDEMFIASDLPAILEHTRTMVFLDDGDVAVVDRDSYCLSRLDGETVDRAPQQISWDPVSAAKGGYKHFMLKEIHEQSRSLSDTLTSRLFWYPAEVRLEDLRLSDEQLTSFERIVIVACGTAWHASLVGKFLFEEIARVPVEVDYADEFRYRYPIVGKNTLLIAVSQSGETVDVLVSMAEGKRLGVTTLGIINVVGSQASRIADSLIYTHAGPEIGVASSKAFTTQLLALFMLALKLGLARGAIGEEEATRKMRELVRVPNLVGRVLENTAIYEELANLYFKCSDFLYLARGINYPIALEGALKLKEISYIHAEGYPAGEMKHGPIALIDEDMPVVAIATRDRMYEKTVSNIEQVKARGGIVIAIATEGDTGLDGKADHIIYVPEIDAHLAPVLTAIPMQLMAYYLAVRRGCDVDQPRNLAKSVTVE